ncbi:phosphatase PAP2 family protein [Paraburkholderia bannensis]|uniref:phosphatase PAP2 family protein n=1 Tax=Paraburkholderia bannensis TaxID=765414 RepID=UPI002AB70B10|nr:phosphatase PAP2 family protein [Paraburkholderia bannensis]
MPKETRRIYAATWWVTIVLIVIDLVWMRDSRLHIQTDSAILSVQTIALIVAITGVFWAVSRRPFKAPARKRLYENVAHVFMWIAVLAVFTHVGIVFQYLCVTTGFPLISDALISADSAPGFHWLDTYRWVGAHHWIRVVLEFAYASGSVQLFAVPIILALTANSRDYAEFVVQFIVATTLVVLIALVAPAESAFIKFGIHDPGTVSTVSDFMPLRNGSARELVFSSAQGLVSFPSLHAILALCLAYALRHVRPLFLAGIALNALMILSTPTQGGHYLSDVLSGLAVGMAVIYLVRKVFAEAKRSKTLQQGSNLITTLNPD